MSESLRIESQKSVDQQLDYLYQHSLSSVHQKEGKTDLPNAKNIYQNSIYVQLQKNWFPSTLKARDPNSQFKETKSSSQLLTFKQTKMKPKIIKPMNDRNLIQSTNSYFFKSPRQRKILTDSSQFQEAKSNTCEKQTNNSDNFFGSHNKIRKVSGRRWQKSTNLAFAKSLGSNQALDIGPCQSVNQSLAESNIFLLSQVSYHKQLLAKQRSACKSTKETTKKLDQICNNLREKNKKLVAVVQQMSSNQKNNQNKQYLSLVKDNQKLTEQNLKLTIQIDEKNSLIQYLQRKLNENSKQLSLVNKKLNKLENLDNSKCEFECAWTDRLQELISKRSKRPELSELSTKVSFISLDQSISDHLKILCKANEFQRAINLLKIIQKYEQFTQLLVQNFSNKNTLTQLEKRKVLQETSTQNGSVHNFSDKQTLIQQQTDRNMDYSIKDNGFKALTQQTNSMQRIENINKMISQVLSSAYQNLQCEYL